MAEKEQARNNNGVRKIMSIIIAAEIAHLRRHKRLPFITASLTFTLLVEGGVAATDAAIIVVAGASLVNAAF